MDNTEYNATSTTAKSCYSTLPAYGTHGKVHGIVAPKPVTAIPWTVRRFGSNYHPNHTHPAPKSCSGYVNLGDMGKPMNLK